MRRRIFIYIMLVTVLTSASVGAALAQIRTIMSKAMPLYERDTVTICVMGDMMMHAAQIENAHRNDGQYDFSSYFSLIEDRIARADIALANMEYTLSGEPYEGYPTFSAPDSYASYLAECGFDIFLAANNHIFDKGSEGAARTLGKYRDLHKSHGIRYCGLASDLEDRATTYPLIITIKGINIALVNFTYGTNLGSDRHWPKVNYMNDKTALKEALTNSRKADFTLVLPHWGNEYELVHSEQQRETACWLIENGADMIIGTHPHVVQDFETINDVQVAYSLGNAVSNMSAANTQLELLAEIRLVREENGDIKILPVEFTWLWCSRPGGYCNSYCVLPVGEFIGSRSKWKGAWEYDKMIATFERVRTASSHQPADNLQH